MKLLLLNPPYVPDFIRSARWTARSISGSNWYPIWLGYCTGLLEKHGHQPKLLDALVEGLSAEQTVRQAVAFEPRITVVYVSLDSLEADILLAEQIRQATACMIVFVGPWASLDPEGILKRSLSVDAVVKGEFDYTVLELAEGGALEKIQGLFWQKEGALHANPPREPVAEEKLDEFPFIADVYRRHLSIKKYYQAPQLHPFIDLFTGRGCDWGRCTFCLWPYAMNRRAPYRTRTMRSVMAEFNFIKKEMPYVKEVFIQDDTLPASRGRALAQAILEGGLKLNWSGYARVDLDYETLKLMKRSGCRCLHVGFESSDAGILKLCAKGITKEMSEKFSGNARRLGLIIHADFIIGLPGETPETIRETIRWAQRLPVHSYQFTLPHLSAATPLYNYLQEHGALLSGELAYPGLAPQQLEGWKKKAIAACHFNPRYFFRMLRLPGEWPRILRAGGFVLRELLKK